jgi:hypothetical protein
MKQRMHIVFLTLLSLVVPAYGNWFGNDTSKKQASKITSDREYIRAENDEKQIDEEIKQIQAEMDEDRDAYKESNIAIEKAMAAYVAECKNPEGVCNFNDTDRLIHEQYGNFARIIKVKSDKEKNLNAEKQQSKKDREVYCETKSIRHYELSTLLGQIERYVSQKDCNKHKLVIEKAKKLIAVSIVPDASFLVDLEMYQNRTTELRNTFILTIAIGRLNELVQLYPEDHDVKRMFEYSQDSSVKHAHLIVEVDKLYAKKSNACFAACKKFTNSLPESLQEEFDKAIEMHRDDVKKLNELYTHYAEKK